MKKEKIFLMTHDLDLNPEIEIILITEREKRMLENAKNAQGKRVFISTNAPLPKDSQLRSMITNQDLDQDNKLKKRK